MQQAHEKPLAPQAKGPPPGRISHICTDICTDITSAYGKAQCPASPPVVWFIKTPHGPNCCISPLSDAPSTSLSNKALTIQLSLTSLLDLHTNHKTTNISFDTVPTILRRLHAQSGCCFSLFSPPKASRGARHSRWRARRTPRTAPGSSSAPLHADPPRPGGGCRRRPGRGGSVAFIEWRGLELDTFLTFFRRPCPPKIK